MSLPLILAFLTGWTPAPGSFRADVSARIDALDAAVPSITAAAVAARDYVLEHPNAGLEISKMECCATFYELAGRAGGLMQIGDISRRPDGVVLFTVRSWEDFGARAAWLVDGWRRMGKLVILVGSRAGMPAAAHPDFFVDNGAADGAKAGGRVNVLVNAAIAWTWVCEYAAAFSRVGRFPAIYRSVATPESFAVITRSLSPDNAPRLLPCQTAIPEGRLGRIYLNSLAKRLVDLGENVVEEGLRKASEVLAEKIAAGGRVGAVGIGHLVMDEVRDPAAPIFGFRWYTIPDALFAALGEGDTLVYYGYAGMGGGNWNYMQPVREGGIGLVASYAPEPQSSVAENPLALIPQMWKLPDAEVAIPVMPFTMGPQSEFDRIVIQRELEARVNALLGQKGVKPPKPSAAFPDEYHDMSYRQGWARESSVFFAEKAPDPDDRWGRLDSTGAPAGPARAQDPFTTDSVPRSAFGYRRFSKQGDVTLVSSNFLWGAVDSAGRVCVPVAYDSLARLSAHLFAAERNGKFGVVDDTGAVVLEFEWDMVDKRRGIGKFTEDGFKFGTIDFDTGKVVEGPVRGDWRKSPLRMPHRTARPAVNAPLACDYAAEEPSGTFRFARGGKWGLAAKDGRIVVPPEYTYVQPADGASFHYVAKGGEWREDVYREMPTIYGAKWGAVALDGTVLVKPECDGLVRDGDGWRYVLRCRLTRQTP